MGDAVVDILPNLAKIFRRMIERAIYTLMLKQKTNRLETKQK